MLVTNFMTQGKSVCAAPGRRRRSLELSHPIKSDDQGLTREPGRSLVKPLLDQTSWGRQCPLRIPLPPPEQRSKCPCLTRPNTHCIAHYTTVYPIITTGYNVSVYALFARSVAVISTWLQY